MAASMLTLNKTYLAYESLEEQVEKGSRNNSRCNSIERSKSPSKSDSWECDTCDKLFENENDKLLTCEYCSNHRCINCLGMSQSVYKGISGRPDLPWFCSNCIVKSLGSLKQTKSIEDRCADYMADFEKRVNERIRKLDSEVHWVKSTLVSMKSEIGDEVKQIMGNPIQPVLSIQSGDKTDNADTIIKQATNEMQSRMDRKNNIVMYIATFTTDKLSELKLRLSLLIKKPNVIAISDISPPLGKSDNSLISFDFNSYVENQNTGKIRYKYDKADFESMRDILDLEWSNILLNKNIDKKWSTLVSKISDAIDKCVPKVKIDINNDN